MPKLVVIYPFRDRETGEHLRPGQEIDVSKNRAQALIRAAVAAPVAEPAKQPEKKKAEAKPDSDKK